MQDVTLSSVADITDVSGEPATVVVNKDSSSHFFLLTRTNLTYVRSSNPLNTPKRWISLLARTPLLIMKVYSRLTEIDALLACYAAYSDSYRRFGTTYGSHLQGSSSNLGCLKMGPIGCPETSVTKYQATLCNIPEERRSEVHGAASLKPWRIMAALELRWKLLTVWDPFAMSYRI